MSDADKARHTRAAELQRLISGCDAEIRKGREKLNALKRAHATAGTKADAPPGAGGAAAKTRLPTEVCQMMCELRDSLKRAMKETAALKKDKAQLIGLVRKTAKDEEKRVQLAEKAKVLYLPSAHFMKPDPAIVAQQRLAHTKNELASVHSVIDAQMKHLTSAFDTAARKCELDKQLMFLSSEVAKKKDSLHNIEQECQSMQRIYNRKKLTVARAPKPMDPMQVLQLDMQKEVAYDALSKQEAAAVAAKESIAYRANLLCQLERTLKVKAEAVQHLLDQMNAADSARGTSSQERGGGGGGGNNSEDGAGGARSVSSSQQQQQQQQQAVRATTLTNLRQKIAALNAKDQQLDKQLEAVDATVCDLEYRAKVMHRATESLEKERGRLLRQHEKQIASLHASAEEQARMAKALIEDERSRSVSQVA